MIPRWRRRLPLVLSLCALAACSGAEDGGTRGAPGDAGGSPDARDAGGSPDARDAGGSPDARDAGSALPPTGLVAIADTRQSIRLDFVSGGGSSYLLKVADVLLTDGNFDATGTAAAAPAPAASGTPQAAKVTPLRTGKPFWVGIASVDGGGKRSTAVVAGPLTPLFDQAAATTSPNTTGNAGLGYAIVHGRFNDDAFDDVAISAPFVTSGGVAAAGEVYVYLGSANGLAATPALTVRGTVASGNLGSSLARLRWSSATRDDLAIGAPYEGSGSGVIYVFDGGAALPSGSVLASTAPRRIGVAAAANWFTGSALGWRLATADHDGDGTDDLVATAPFGSSGSSGAAIVLYGGTVPTGNVLLSDVSAAGSGTAVVRMYEDPDATGSLFGNHAHSVGRTLGAADTTDDLVIGYAEDGIAGASVIVYRGAGRPAAAGVTRSPFTVGRDVEIRLGGADTALEWGVVATSIADQNGDGAREIVLADPRVGTDSGAVFIVSGSVVGTSGVHTVDTSGTGALTVILGGTANRQFGMAVLDSATGRDVDGDGKEDLVIASRASGSAQVTLGVWFGPIAPGVQAAPSPDHTIVAPASFVGALPGSGGSPLTAIWAGDVNGDGLADVCLADWTSTSLDGAFQMLWDDGK